MYRTFRLSRPQAGHTGALSRGTVVQLLLRYYHQSRGHQTTPSPLSSPLGGYRTSRSGKAKQKPNTLCSLHKQTNKPRLPLSRAGSADRQNWGPVPVVYQTPPEATKPLGHICRHAMTQARLLTARDTAAVSPAGRASCLPAVRTRGV